MFMKLVEPDSVYLDVCALGRPYDDQRIRRNEIETIALVTIISLIREGKYTLYYSPVHEEEIEQNSKEAQKVDLLTFLYGYGKDAAVEFDYEGVEARALELIDKGFGYADAFHAANAEALDTSFITCDDDLIKKCRRVGLRVWYGTTVDFCKKVGLL
jgi:predicted nucleic acid-binding protein